MTSVVSRSAPHCIVVFSSQKLLYFLILAVRVASICASFRQFCCHSFLFLAYSFCRAAFNRITSAGGEEV